MEFNWEEKEVWLIRCEPKVVSRYRSIGLCGHSHEDRACLTAGNAYRSRECRESFFWIISDRRTKVLPEPVLTVCEKCTIIECVFSSFIFAKRRERERALTRWEWLRLTWPTESWLIRKSRRLMKKYNGHDHTLFSAYLSDANNPVSKNCYWSFKKSAGNNWNPPWLVLDSPCLKQTSVMLLIPSGNQNSRKPTQVNDGLLASCFTTLNKCKIIYDLYISFRVFRSRRRQSRNIIVKTIIG